jgi:hypothetical protein
MIPIIVEATYKEKYTLRIVFSDGTEGEIDLSKELYGEVFEPLKDPSFFSKVFVHPEFHTLCWPNGADFAPEFLYENVWVLSR